MQDFDWHFDCRLSNWGSSDPFPAAQLTPCSGRLLTINGKNELIPEGVLLGSGGILSYYNNCSINKITGQTLSANTTYWVYAYISLVTGVMTLDFSTTGWQFDPEWGYEVKTTDRTCTLVGLLYAQNISSVIVTRGGANAQTIISRHNMLDYYLLEGISGSITSTGAFQEISGTMQWVQWSDHLPTNPHIIAQVQNSVGGNQSAVAINGTGPAGTIPSTDVFCPLATCPTSGGYVMNYAETYNPGGEGYFSVTTWLDGGEQMGVSTVTIAVGGGILKIDRMFV